MSTIALIVCKAFLQKCHPKKRESLISYLPAAEKSLVESLPPTHGDPAQGFESLAEFLNKIHFSWFSTFLRTLAENEIRLFVASLSEHQAKGLKKILRLSNSLPALTSFSKHFFHERLLDALKEKNQIPLPISCLPVSPMNVLLELDEEELNALVKYLGLHDLALELRYIIETAKLKLIHTAFSEEELHYLKTLMQQKEALSFKRMNLDRWDGSIEDLKSMLQQRGLNRLAKSLFGLDPNLIWHLRHRFDTEKAASLQKLSTALEHPKAATVLMQQVIDTASFIQNRKNP